MMKQINWSDHILNFLAVIIGVTLAFYVSNNSEEIKKNEEFEQIVASFIEELGTERKIYQDYQIPSNTRQAKLIDNVIEALHFNKIDSLSSDKIQEALGINSYSPSKVTFNSIVSSGKFELFKDFKIRKQISNYHQISASEAEIRGQLQLDFYMDHIFPWIINNTNILKPDMNSLLSDTQFSNILILYRSLIRNKIRQYEELVGASEKLEAELKQLISE